MKLKYTILLLFLLIACRLQTPSYHESLGTIELIETTIVDSIEVSVLTTTTHVITLTKIREEFKIEDDIFYYGKSKGYHYIIRGNTDELIPAYTIDELYG